MRRLAFFVPSGRTDRRGDPAPLPGRNETDRYRSRRAANRVKQQEKARVAAICRRAMAEQGWEAPRAPARVTLVWVERDRRRDQDNVRSYEKWLLDGIVAAGALGGDSPRWIEGCSRSSIEYDRDSPGVRVYIDAPEG